MQASTESWRGRIALMVAHCAGMVDLVALPVWVGALIAQYGFSPQQAGGLATLFLLGAVAEQPVLRAALQPDRRAAHGDRGLRARRGRLLRRIAVVELSRRWRSAMSSRALPSAARSASRTARSRTAAIRTGCSPSSASRSASSRSSSSARRRT